MEIDNLSGTYGGNRKPTPFMCLIMKMLQIQPEKDIVVEFIKDRDYKYVRILGAFYLRLTGTVMDVYQYLEPLYNDYRKLMRKLPDGRFSLTHVDEVIDELLTRDYSCDLHSHGCRKGIGKTVKEKVFVHTSRDIRAIASHLVNMWIEVFCKEKAVNGRLKLFKQSAPSEISKGRPRDMVSGKMRLASEAADGRGDLLVPLSTGSHSPSRQNIKRTDSQMVRLETLVDPKSEANSSRSHSLVDCHDSNVESDVVMSAAIAAAEAARAAALAAAEAFASTEAENSALRDLPKIPSFHKFARREQYAQVDDSDFRRRWSGGIPGRQDCSSEIDSRNCRVKNWSVDFAESKLSGDNFAQRSNSNETTAPLIWI